MGLKKIVENFKNKKQQKLEEKNDQRKQTQKRVESMKRAISWAEKGTKVYRKVEEKQTQFTERARSTAERVEPLAERIDNTTDRWGKEAVSGYHKARNSVSETFDKARQKTKETTSSVREKASKKYEEYKEDNAKKPTSGSSLLDLLSPVVPENDYTKRKKPEPPKNTP